MDFYTNSKVKRPIRLCEETRKFASESMHGKYGDDAMLNPYVSLDDIDGYDQLSPQKQYDCAIVEIAKRAPIRICDNETVCGAATLGMAIKHLVPAFYKGEKTFHSVSHITIDFATVVHKGVDYLEQKIDNRLQDELTQSQREQVEGFKNVINAMHIWHGRYLDELKIKNSKNYEILKDVPFSPAKSFKEAVQSLWFVFAFTRLCGNWPGIGRIDEILGGYLKEDLKSGKITIDEAREYLAGMFIKGCEWIQSDTPLGSGDAQHYQNIVLGGIDENGIEVTNEVTYLILDIVEELGISDFPITVRINKNTPDKLLTRVAEVMRYGGGIIAIYNEPLIIKSLVESGYDEKESRKFANDGCWEIQIPGKTCFSYVPFDSLQVLLNDTLKLNTDSPCCFDTFDDLYKCFVENMGNAVEKAYEIKTKPHIKDDGTWEWKNIKHSSVVSIFEQGCIESGRSYYEGGPVYTIVSPHIGGAPDTANSLYCIDRLVFREKLVSFSELLDILKNNWEGHEGLRQYVLNKYIYYGNDNDDADSYMVRLIDDFVEKVKTLNNRCPIKFPAGISTFGRQIEWTKSRCAVPFGRKKGEILSGNTSPTPNTDFEGATSIIRSYCKINHEKLPCGSALDVKLYPSTVSAENGIVALKELIKGFVKLGGFFMQLDVVNSDILRAAQENPADYKTLSVRVSGWNARFVTLDKQWQQMIIERTEQDM